MKIIKPTFFCYHCHVTALRVVITVPVFLKVSIRIQYSKEAEIFKIFLTENKPMNLS